MKKAYLIFGLLFFATLANAQNYIDLAKFDYATSTENTFDTGSAKTGLQEMNGNLTVPLVINEKAAFLTGFTYETSIASFNPNSSVESVTGITLKLGANIKHNEKWSGTYMLLPKISSDLKSTAKNDFQFGAVALMKYKKTDHFNYKFGLYSNAELFGPFFVPIFGFYYLSPSDKFEAKVLLPLAVDLNYSITKSVRFGLNFKGQVRTYNLNTPIGSETNRYMAKSTNDVYTYVQYGMKNGFNIQLGLGKSVARSFRIYDEKVSFGMPLTFVSDDRTQLNTDFSDSWLVKVSVFYRLKINSKS
tara:strand:- start:1411 stop:2319 length:909 start_codon:yes stop_codon:yes gene_type:complete